VPTASVEATGVAGPTASASAVPAVGATDSSDQGGGLAIGLVALGLIGGGGALFFVFYRRRRGTQPDEPLVSDDLTIAHLEVFADPLLEAMASSARSEERRGRPKKRLEEGKQPVSAWVRRLDSEINVLTDLRTVPSPPPHDRSADVSVGPAGPASPAGDQSASA
jgi:hypothetical protein